MSDPVEDPAVPALPLRLAIDNSLSELHRQMPVSLQLLLDPKLFAQVEALAEIMAKDTVFTPAHLRGKPQACHTVVSLSLQWRIDPHFVARCTYMTPGGQIGFEGKLVQAILEKSNRFIGAPDFEYFGDWSRVTGKFVKATSNRGNEYVKPAWTANDADGCGILIRWQVRGEEKPRVWPAEDMPFYLTQCFPLNSPLWATDPRSQIRYLAIRRFADQSAPGILSGMPFDPDDLFDASERARDVTAESPPPRPTRESVEQARQPQPGVGIGGDLPVTDVEPELEKPYSVTSYTGDIESFADPKAALEDWFRALRWAGDTYGTKGLEAVWESNSELYAALDAAGFSDLSTIARNVYKNRHEAAVAREPAQEPDRGRAGPTPPPPVEATPAAPMSEEPPFSAGPSTGPLGLGVPERDPIWQGDDLAFEPSLHRGQPDWVSYTTKMRRLIAEAADLMELDALRHAHSANLITLSTANPKGWQRIADDYAEMRSKLEGQG